ncbi:MAG: hypothetical protein R8G33_08085 [Gammaproteobacteria bacterium]|nr:hypothetical protein [Gammaproteobacteria bacterium]
MNKKIFPYIALTLGIICMLVVIVGGDVGDNQSTNLPLLTLLIICEFAFFVCSIGAYMCVREVIDVGFTALHIFVGVICALLAARFFMLGINFWPL